MVNKLYIAAGDKLGIPVDYICQITPSPTHPQSLEHARSLFHLKPTQVAHNCCWLLLVKAVCGDKLGAEIFMRGDQQRENVPRRIHSQEPGEFYDHASKFEKQKKKGFCPWVFSCFWDNIKDCCYLNEPINCSFILSYFLYSWLCDPCRDLFDSL